MRRYSRKTLTTLFIVAAVLSVVQLIVMFALGAFNDMGASVTIPIIVLSLPLLPLTWCGIFLNWKKMLIGFIAPIPIISYLVETVKGYVYAVKGFVVLVKQKEALVIGDDDREMDNQDVG